MRVFIKLSLMFMLIGLLVKPGGLQAQNRTVSVDSTEGNTIVMMLEGQAFLVREDLGQIRSLSQGDLLRQGDRVQTEKNSRLELKLPDGSFVRFDEMTVFILQSAIFDPEQKRRDIDVTLVLGKIWAKVARFLNRQDRFTLTTQTAVAGVRGTVYRMNVNPDNSAFVKVYDGEVEVRGQKPEKAASATGSKEPAAIPGPHPVPGPHPIPGPHPVTMQEWIHIVSAMQQIDIQSDGTPSKPFNFSPEADRDGWVLWNQERDR